MQLIRRNLLRFGAHGSRLIGRYYGEQFPFYYVTEYPKSGGTWLAQMIADYLQIPRPAHNLLPMACTCVLHNHWAYEPRLRRVFYLYRDGRDVMVSFFFHRMRELAIARETGEGHPLTKLYERLFGKGYDPQDIRRYLRLFIQQELDHPVGVPTSWDDHIRQWAFSDHPGVVTVSYEALLKDAVGALEQIIPTHSGKPFDRDLAKMTVDKFTFRRQTGRKAGQEDRLQFKRKGVAGDWVNHFDRATAQYFDERCGEMLLRLGYVESRDWWKAVDP